MTSLDGTAECVKFYFPVFPVQVRMPVHLQLGQGGGGRGDCCAGGAQRKSDQLRSQRYIFFPRESLGLILLWNTNGRAS